MTAGAVLAAGAGVRMGGPKADLEIDGVRLLDRAVSALLGGGCDPVYAVVRPGTVVQGALAVVNGDPGRGLRSSLDLAVTAAGEVDALVVLLADLPDVDSPAVSRVRAGWRPGRIALARYGIGADATTGHPIAMSPEFWREALALAGPDEGARRYLAAHPDLVDEIEADGALTDLDTPADLESWLRDHPRRASQS